MDLTLSSEQDAVRKAVKEWVDDVVVPPSLQNDREERFPQEALDGLRQTGFIGLSIPEQYGGGGGDPLSYVLCIEELGRGDANVRSIVSVHLGLVAGSIDRWGTQEQKEQWLPRMATGEVLGCFGLTEPDFGSNPADLQASAVKQPDGGYVLNGTKIFITNGTIAGVTLFMARTGGPGARGVSAFLVPNDSARLRGPQDPRQARAALVRHRRAGPARRQGRPRGAARRRGGQGHPGRPDRPQRRPDVARGLVHRARPGGARHDGEVHDRAQAVRQGHRRPPAGAGALIADTAVEVDCARLLTWRVADLKTRGEDYSLAASKAKYYASEASVRAANACVQAHGGYGYIDEYPAGKYLRDARVTTLYEGTSQIQQLIIGRALTGISAF